MPLIRRLAAFWLLLGSLVHAADPAPAVTGHRTIITRVPPVYPELARRMHITGTVILRVVIQPNGAVTQTHIQSGHPLLAGAAQDAVAQWRFSPAPDPTTMDIDIVFIPSQPNQ